MFSLILPSRPCLTTTTPLPSSPNGNQFAFTFPLLPRFSHVVVFLNPGVEMPEGTAAGVYLHLPGDVEGSFKFLGGLGKGKESAIFKVTLPPTMGRDEMGVDGATMGSGAGPGGGGGEVTVGISVEPIAVVEGQMVQLQQQQQQQQQQSPAQTHGFFPQQQQQQPSTKVLAQRIIKNAFNFLAGFSGRVGEGGIEVVPLKSFEDWWRKFERRVELDPGFLEREDQG